MSLILLSCFVSSRFLTPTARMCLSSSARRCLSSNANRNPTQPPSRSDPHVITIIQSQLADQVCEDVHRKIPQRISRTVPKKTCNGGGGSGSAPALPERQTGSGGGGYRLTLFLAAFCPANRLCLIWFLPGLAQAATSLCSPGLLAAPTQM